MGVGICGGRQEKRKYPWPTEKGEPNSTLLNYNNNVGATTRVGSYPEGATPEGLYDMAGNVWEWTGSWWDDTTRSDRVLRGGAGTTVPGAVGRRVGSATPPAAGTAMWASARFSSRSQLVAHSGFAFEREGSNRNCGERQ